VSLRTLVVGGGIGGLSVARELAIRGLSVTVLERAAAPAPVGAGIIMNPNAMRVLERNGLAAALRPHGWPYLARETRDRRGRLLAVRDYRPLYETGAIAVGTLVHRAHLHEVLQDALPPGTVRFGARVEHVEQGPAGVRVVTASAGTFEGDLLVGADGIRSSVRDRLFGRTEPVYLGYRSHRLVVDNEDGVEHFTEFLGRGQRVGLVPISKVQLYVWTTFNSPHGAGAPRLAGGEELRAFFGGFTDRRVRGALARLRSPEALLCTDVEEIRLADWVRGRVALLGDAAHAMSPNIGQGAGMAMEDAAVLAGEVAAAAAGRESLEAALARYVARRRPRVHEVTRISREVGEEGQLTGALAVWRRNQRLRRQGRNVAAVRAGLVRLLASPL
jgi:2-polyprenyl-6-methoxyphenol hydroxylase-like FAD-dependent oxidoreductase